MIYRASKGVKKVAEIVISITQYALKLGVCEKTESHWYNLPPHNLKSISKPVARYLKAKNGFNSLQ